MVSVLKHFLARPHMAHADNAADGRQRNMMRTQEALAAAEDHSRMAARIRSGALALQLQAGNSFVAAGLSTVAVDCALRTLVSDIPEGALTYHSLRVLERNNAGQDPTIEAVTKLARRVLFMTGTEWQQPAAAATSSSSSSSYPSRFPRYVVT